MDARGERSWCGQCGAVELWPENVPAVLLYLACDTQWRHAGMTGVPTGLNYDGVRAVMDMQAIPPADRPALFVDLQTLERAQLQVVHQRLAQERSKPAPTATRPRPGQ
jgi:hypothetical protein